MIDTIKLSLGNGMFWLTDPSRFQKEKMNASRGFFTLVQNPTKLELKSGVYKPRLTLTKRFNYSGRFEPTLTIELSLPKLKFGNNFDELIDNNFSDLVEKLRLLLNDMGVKVFTSVLQNSPVSAVHYSKNIPLTDGTTPHYLIKKIKEANIKLSLDVNQTDYRNDGHSYKWHSNSYEVAFYDKIKDIEMAKKSDKRAVERDNGLQLGLFEAFQKRKRFEVLRMEVRLNNRQKIKQLFKTITIQNNLTFKELFSSTISQKVLLFYLSEIERNRPMILNYQTSNPKTLLADLIINNPDMGMNKIMQTYGLKLCLDSINYRELRIMFNKLSQRSWYRLIADVKKIKLPASKNPLSVINKHLNDFEPLKLVDFQDIMINNDKYAN